MRGKKQAVVTQVKAAKEMCTEMKILYEPEGTKTQKFPSVYSDIKKTLQRIYGL